MKKSIEARGYAVIAARYPHAVGQRIHVINAGDPWNEFDHPFTVIAVTDRADYEAQCVLGGDLPYVNPAYQFFYRVTTD